MKTKIALIILGITALSVVGLSFLKTENLQNQNIEDPSKTIIIPEITTSKGRSDLIRLDSPLPNEIISSPLVIKGEARGNWFFEASFPVVLTDWDGLIIAQGIATAKDEWMTTDFVPFEATLIFNVDKDIYSNRGSLILRKDNPSGLSEYDDALEIPIVFAKSGLKD